MDHSMDHNIQNNINNIIHELHDGQPNVIQSDYFPTSDDNIAQTSSYTANNNYEQQPAYHNQHDASTSQSQPTINSTYAPQYTVNNNVQNPLNFPPTNHPEFFRFEIPGFEIIVIPTFPLPNLSNSSMQDQSQQDT